MKNSAEAQVPLSIMAAVNHGRETVLTKCQHTLDGGGASVSRRRAPLAQLPHPPPLFNPQRT